MGPNVEGSNDATLCYAAHQETAEILLLPCDTLLPSPCQSMDFCPSKTKPMFK